MFLIDWILLPVKAIFVIWLIADMYICYRWIRKPEVDYTAGVLSYWITKWLNVTQSKRVAEKLVYPSQDLSEMVGLKPDDGKIT